MRLAMYAMHGKYVYECNRTLKGFNNDIMVFSCCGIKPLSGFCMCWCYIFHLFHPWLITFNPFGITLQFQ